MPPRPKGPVHVVLRSHGWPDGAREVVLASLRGQVSSIGSDVDTHTAHPVAVLLVTAPVVFARGAIGEIERNAAHVDRVVTRVLVPGGGLASVALWSGAWLARHDVDLSRLVQDGIAFDRDHLPHDDPHVRAWVRADEVGVARYQANTPGTNRWVRVAGLRLLVRRVGTPWRGVLGRIRRMASLARQRRRHSRPD